VRPTLFGSFCKTEFKPYDVLVTCSLLIIKHHLGNRAIVRTDGNERDWDDARILCFSRLGYGSEYTLDDDFGLMRGYFTVSDAIADANLADTDACGNTESSLYSRCADEDANLLNPPDASTESGGQEEQKQRE
jgi:hypothetical protein